MIRRQGTTSMAYCPRNYRTILLKRMPRKFKKAYKQMKKANVKYDVSTKWKRKVSALNAKGNIQFLNYSRSGNPKKMPEPELTLITLKVDYRK